MRYGLARSIANARLVEQGGAELDLSPVVEAVPHEEIAKQPIIGTLDPDTVVRPVGDAELELEVAGVQNAGWRAEPRPVGAEIAQRLALGWCSGEQQQDKPPSRRPPHLRTAS